MTSYPISFPSGSSGSSSSLLTLTRPSPSVWEIEMHNGQDNRFARHFIDGCLIPALDLVEKEWRSIPGSGGPGAARAPGALVITGRKDQGKFFSNGLDFENAMKDPNFLPHSHDPLLLRLLSFPIPIVAAINGHAFAFGFIFTLACDYRVMTSGRAWGSLNEITFGSPFSKSTNAIFNLKIANFSTFRRTLLEGHRWVPTELVAAGIVDALVDPVDNEAVARGAREFAEGKAELAKSGAYGLIKKELARKVFEACARDERMIGPADEKRVADARL